jgi:hypothetical protein
MASRHTSTRTDHDPWVLAGMPADDWAVFPA